MIAERAATDRSLQWNGHVNEYTVAMLGAMVGFTVLVLFFMRRSEREHLWFALLLLAMAADTMASFSMQIALLPVPLYDLIDGAMQSVALFAALAFFSIVLRAPRSKTWWVVAALLLINVSYCRPVLLPTHLRRSFGNRLCAGYASGNTLDPCHIADAGDAARQECAYPACPHASMARLRVLREHPYHHLAAWLAAMGQVNGNPHCC